MVTLICVTLKSFKPLLQRLGQGVIDAALLMTLLTTLKRIFLSSFLFYIQFISISLHQTIILSTNAKNYQMIAMMEYKYPRNERIITFHKLSFLESNPQKPDHLHWTRLSRRDVKHRSKQGPNNNNVSAFSIRVRGVAR